MSLARRYDVAIVGAGMAGLTLARHLQLKTQRRVLLLERREQSPGARQKVGESTVQLGGYYLGKVLELEEVLLCEHLMKYNLRFNWLTETCSNRTLADYGQLFSRPLSNIAGYQLDRNRFEEKVREQLLGAERISLAAPVENVTFELGGEGRSSHRLRFQLRGEECETHCDWLVDASGRNRFLARKLGLKRSSPLRHGAAYLWVDGLIDIERLGGGDSDSVRLDRMRRVLGHLPVWLATNHFMGDGFWLWVIPLKGKTSVGVVYDRERVDGSQFSTPQKLTRFIAREFPLFAPELARRRVLDSGGFRDFAYDCSLALSPERWALTGEAARFSDPLYSPATDLLALHNTLIVAAIEASGDRLGSLCGRYEDLLRALYEAYLPSYGDGYETLCDQEAFTLRYLWEIVIYFAFYVFPFINDLFTDPRMIAAHLARFSRLGTVNRQLQAFLRDYVEWKRRKGLVRSAPLRVDLSEL
ncbi:MAG TPA: FAD-dependent oxidoreductase, partial [Thermoanaerobaculia bacterium]|nr:FAD-dependent oxidoreductase [Thermoanaerobaculia bacterium]